MSSPAVPDPFAILQHRVAEVHWRWKVWKQLYMSSESAIRLMNRAAPSLFAMIKDIMVEDVMLRLCKLADPPEGAGRPNLVLARVLKQAASRLDKAELAAAMHAAHQLTQAIAPLRTIRNRRIAHEDHATTVGDDVLPKVSDAEVDQALARATALIELLDPKRELVHFAYNGMIAVGDGESLLYALECAEQYRSECLKRGVRPLSDAAARGLTASPCHPPPAR